MSDITVTSDATLSPNVQMQLMRPAQVDAAAKAFPVVYVPFGLIEWHGRHLPLGTDCLKAHAILVKTAERFGGVVYPPMYFPHTKSHPDGVMSDEDDQRNSPVLTFLFERLKLMGFRVIIGVSGHNIAEQKWMVDRALEPVIADGTITGVGLWEISLTDSEEARTDHAGSWETSDMLYSYPELVDLSALGTGPLAGWMKPPDGIGGLDPRVHASAETGRRKCELCAESIGRKARELLESLPPEHRAFRLPALAPEHWWEI